MFPFKSLTGVDVPSATIGTGGALRGDREFALFDERGAVINAKREPLVHDLNVVYDRSITAATFRSSLLESTFTFDFADAPHALEAWLSEHFERPVSVRRQPEGGFPDDTKTPGPTVVSTATLHEVATWFDALDAASLRLRLRANLEFGGLPPFGEDALYAVAGETVAFRVGAAIFEGTNPCARCVVPSRDPSTGEAIPSFAKVVSAGREITLPAFAERSRFDHFYRLAVNTRARASELGKSVAVGDFVELLAYVRGYGP